MDGKARLLRTGDGPARRELCDYRLAKTTADIRYECTQQLALSETLEADGPYFYKILFISTHVFVSSDTLVCKLCILTVSNRE